MRNLPRTLVVAAYATALAACSADNGDGQSAQNTRKDNGAPTGSILPSGSDNSPSWVGSANQARPNSGGFNNAFQGGLR